MTETATLWTALVAAQADMPALQRDKLNPHFKSSYLSLEKLLEEVLPVLNRHGFAVTQWPCYVNGVDGAPVPALSTVLVHGASGEQFTGTMLLLPAKMDPQGQGAAITYAKRYALMALCGLSADEDDDGNMASGRARGARQTSSNGKTITETERKRLFAVAKASSIEGEALKQYVKDIAGVDSTNDIPRSKYDALIAVLEGVKVAA